MPFSKKEKQKKNKKKTKKTLWPLFMDGVQPPQGYSHFEEAVYFLSISFQKFLVLTLSTSAGWKNSIFLNLNEKSQKRHPVKGDSTSTYPSGLSKIHFVKGAILLKWKALFQEQIWFNSVHFK